MVSKDTWSKWTVLHYNEFQLIYNSIETSYLLSQCHWVGPVILWWNAIYLLAMALMYFWQYTQGLGNEKKNIKEKL